MPIDLDVSHFQDAVFWLLKLFFVFCFPGCWTVPTVACVFHSFLGC